MAEQAVTTTRQPKRRRAAPRTTRRRSTTNGNGRTRRRAKASNLSQLERLIRDLEARVSELTSASGIRSNVRHASSQVGSFVSGAVTGATNQMGEAVADTLTEVADKFRNGAHSVASMAQIGTGAIRKISDEVEKRPFMTVAIALGIGFLAGLAGKGGELSGSGRRH